MEKPAFTRMNLSSVGVIMALMRVHVVELLCQAVTGWIPVVKHAWAPVVTSYHAKH
jgi:hypothetical protein